ncbi:MAG: electron transfer flavoprotein subunit beta/FixA family protein [Dehalococcoidia bacterium]|nr:MAG: electron transfer flavoprotein subunit beta/FixA family protein [Dehalococcoidia bacterium]
MKVVVCVARVVDTREPLPLRSGQTVLQEEGLRHTLNPADDYALEESLRLKDRSPDSDVTAISMGPPGSESALRRCLAVGADEALLLWDEAFRDSDTLATARILAAAIRQVGADVVLCGKRASDGDTGQVGAQLAELLDLPVVTSVLRLEVQDGEALVHRRLERGRREVLRCPLPALFAVDEGMNRPRYPKLRALLQSLAAEIPRRSLADLGLRADEVGEAGSHAQVVSLSPPKPITKGLFIPDSSLSPEERWQQIVSGGMEERHGDVIEGPPDTMAERLLQFLTENNFV